MYEALLEQLHRQTSHPSVRDRGGEVLLIETHCTYAKEET